MNATMQPNIHLAVDPVSMNLLVQTDLPQQPQQQSPSVSQQQLMLDGVQGFRFELEGGQYTLTRDFFAKLRAKNQSTTNEKIRTQNDKTRAACMDRLAQCYRGTDGSVPEPPLQAIDEWIIQEPDNQDAHLLKGLFLITKAWSVLRRHRDESDTQDDEAQDFALFDKLAHKAERSLQRAIKIDPTDPLPYADLLTASRGLSKLKAAFAKFQQDCRNPQHVTVHTVMLYRLSPHWGGSVQEMLEFARSATLKADAPPPAGHPLWSLLCKAHLDAWDEDQKKNTDTDDQKQKDSSSSHQYWKNLSNTQKKELVHAYRKFRGTSSSDSNNSTQQQQPKKVEWGNFSSHGKKTTDTVDPSLQFDDDEVRECSNLFAYCLYNVKAYSEAHLELEKIGSDPLPEPWNKESATQWRQFYQHAKKKVAERAAIKNWSMDATAGDSTGGSNHTKKESVDFASSTHSKKWDPNNHHLPVAGGASTHSCASSRSREQVLRRRSSSRPRSSSRTRSSRTLNSHLDSLNMPSTHSRASTRSSTRRRASRQFSSGSSNGQPRRRSTLMFGQKKTASNRNFMYYSGDDDSLCSSLSGGIH